MTYSFVNANIRVLSYLIPSYNSDKDKYLVDVMDTDTNPNKWTYCQTVQFYEIEVKHGESCPL